MNRWLARKILYPLHERLRGRPTYEILRRLRRSEHLTPAELAQARDRAIAVLVKHAALQTPYWREHFASARLASDAIQGAAGLSRLPPMDKDLIRSRLEDFVADDERHRAFKLETGGSSGSPLIFYTDKVREASQLAAKARSREWWGIRPGDRQIDLWGSPIELNASDRMRELKDRCLNLRLLSAFKLSDESMSRFRSAIETHGTDFIYGYASVLARFARFLEDREQNLHHLNLAAAISTAELLFDDQREVIERVFGCAVVNEYGCRDGGLIAQTCPEGGLHLMSDTVHVEILSEELEPVEPGEIGEIVITNLYSRAMPLIRYRLGDRARLKPEPCPCGRSLPLMDSLEGRVTDTVFTPDGNRVHGLGLMYTLRVLPGIARFQVIQDALDHLEILIVPTAEAVATASTSLVGPVVEGTRKTVGDGMVIDVRIVDEIPVLPSGKMRSIWNKLED